MRPSVPDLVEFADAALAADYTRLRRVGQRMSKAIEVEDPEGTRRFRLALNKKGVPLQASGSCGLVNYADIDCMPSGIPLQYPCFCRPKQIAWPGAVLAR